jgi:4-alpha-glucanotransferase
MAQKITNTVQKPFARLTGTVAPLGALRTDRSCGIGEYPDLETFADFCSASGLKIIQLLPVNDTGTESSPYSALSAFALHPAYIGIENLPEFQKSPGCADKLKKLKEKLEKLPRFSYKDARTEKLAILRGIYEDCADSIAADAAVTKWIAARSPWIVLYSVFMELKRAHNDASWKEWPARERGLSVEQIIALWEDKNRQKDYLFYAWVQMRADEQFKKAADYAAKHGIVLKGDIPILMNEDSCDVWAHPEFFDRRMTAGAPPDMYIEAGQNWGFPVYNWDKLEKADFRWWKDRLVSASRYYKAIRLDHILGFFRIFKMSERDFGARLGYPDPCVPITGKELAALGFPPERIRWLSQPHVPTMPCLNANGGDYLGTHGILRTALDRIGEEELWLFKPEIAGEKDIAALDIPQGVKNVLLDYWHNRALLKIGTAHDGEFMPIWTYEKTTAWNSLGEEEKTALRALIDKKNKKMEKLWEDRARTILGAIAGATEMTACAEDLGVNLKAVPKVLGELSILSLRVVRWARDWGKTDKTGQTDPFVPFKKYPALSVTTTSVHDSSPSRVWWEGERGADGEIEYKGFVALYKPPAKIAADIEAGTYSPAVAKWFLEQAATSASAYCIHPIQDFLAMSETYRASGKEAVERINVPGTVNDFNWTYRLPVTVETLLADKAFIKEIAAIAKKHE